MRERTPGRAAAEADGRPWRPQPLTTLEGWSGSASSRPDGTAGAGAAACAWRVLARRVAGAGIALAAVALLRGTPPRELAAERFAAEWARGSGRRGLRAAASRIGELRPRSLAALRGAASTATLSGASVTRTGGERRPRGVYRVPVRERTRAFGTLRERLVIATAPSADGRLEPGRSRSAGCAAREPLRRVAVAPRRGVLLTRDGTSLDALASASNVIGTIGHASGARAARDGRGGLSRRRPRSGWTASSCSSSASSAASRAASSSRDGACSRATARDRGDRRADLDLPDAADAGGQPARGAPRRDRGDGARQRRAPRRRGHPAVRAPAARVDVQDHHADRRCSRRTSRTPRRSSPTRPRRRSTTSCCTTATARTAAARSRTRSPCPAIPCSRRSACASAPRG